ncbi:MAG: rhodanese-like domain-containing protein [Defluviitaleaceae bacterium]|nr:rhodanese-like domain-containing protein [Defluviitaleaceae bacterium]
MKRIFLFAIIFTFSIFITACQVAQVPFEELQNGQQITASQANEIINTHPDAIIVDVRTRQEFNTERIPGAILLTQSSISEHAETVLPDKDALILVYCQSGNRSRSAVRLLVSMGYTNILDFGGIRSWPYETD